MWLWIVLLIIIAIIFGLGFVLKWLFYIAVILFVIWLIVLIARGIRGGS